MSVDFLGHLTLLSDLLQLIFVRRRALTILHFLFFLDNYKANCYQL